MNYPSGESVQRDDVVQYTDERGRPTIARVWMVGKPGTMSAVVLTVPDSQTEENGGGQHRHLRSSDALSFVRRGQESDTIQSVFLEWLAEQAA